MLRSGQAQNNRFRRDAWLEVNLANLEFNINALYQEFQKPLIPVIKADAYGHGANVFVELLDSYDFIYAYAVASIDEALAIREISSSKIMVLGITPVWALEAAIANDIDITIAELKTAQEADLLAQKLGKKAKIHLKLDTGMNRIGLKEASSGFLTLKNVDIETVFTHMADPSNKEFLLEQEKEFFDLVNGFAFEQRPKVHTGSSIAARHLKSENFDLLRVGIELYGLENPKLKPLLSLYARVSFLKNIKAGESVSYSRTWFAKRDSKIATLPLGYADGLHRLMSNKIEACFQGEFIKQVGTITMDQVMFDLTDLKADINVGDTVELLGENISIEKWAQAANTISYEIATALNLRLPKTYTRK